MKTILITGATDGIGRLTAEKLVNFGHHILIHGRNQKKLQDTEDKLKSIDKGKVTSITADLSIFAEVEALTKQVASHCSKIDILINNAGIYKTHAPITKDNLDVRFVVNTIAPFLITTHLLPLMNKSGRVVNISSAAQAPVDLNALTGKYHLDDPFTAYAQSKLGITMWSRYLSENSNHNTPDIISLNPGSLLASKMVKEGFGVKGNDLNIGVEIIIEAALGEKFNHASGKYFDNDSGNFTDPHEHALDKKNCQQVVTAIEATLEKFVSKE